MQMGIIFDVKEFTVHDGPGIRTTIFMKGCPLHCLWCHNPEGLSAKPQIMIRSAGCVHCGLCRQPCHHPECREMGRCVHVCPNGLLQIAGYHITVHELAEQVKRKSLLMDEGGVTISGGEPLFQPLFLLELLQELRPLHTIVETSGHSQPEVFQKAALACDMIYLDIKHMDPTVHKRLTGVDNELIQQNLRWLVSANKNFVIRATWIPTCNDDLENLEQLAGLLKNAKNLLGVEILPYNPLAPAKYELLGLRPVRFPEQNMPQKEIEHLFFDAHIPVKVF